MKRSMLGWLLAALSVVAGVIHFWVTPEHFEEFVPFGVFFLILGAFQLIWALPVALRPHRVLLVLGAIVNGAVVGIWAVSRTVGLPIGPEPGEPEAVGTLDLIATVAEALIVMGSIWLATRRPGGRRLPVEHEEQGRRVA